MIVHAGMPNDVAYALCEAIESRKDLIPTDNYKPLNIRQLCANDDQAPFDVPLHPGARQFYRERGYEIIYPPSQKSTGVSPWMSEGILRSLGEGGYASACRPKSASADEGRRVSLDEARGEVPRA